MVRKEIQRDRTVDFLKGICILIVCFTHYAWEDAERSALLFPWWVDMAVPVFMILSGYVYEKSLVRRNVDSLLQEYTLQTVLHKAIRLTVPVLLIYAVTLLWDLFKRGGISYGLLMTFLRGGKGPGAYYYPVMMQVIFVLPVIGYIVRQREEKGLLLCLLVNAVYEVLHVAYYIPDESYRLLMFRYVFVLAVGCYLALGKTLSRKVSVPMFFAGAVFLYCYTYRGYTPKFITAWTGTSFLAAMYIIPFVQFFVQRTKIHFAPVELLGKASYQIFLSQMFYYYALAAGIYARISSRAVQLIVSMAVCLLAGLVFWRIETPVTRWIQSGIPLLFSPKKQTGVKK